MNVNVQSLLATASSHFVRSVLVTLVPQQGAGVRLPASWLDVTGDIALRAPVRIGAVYGVFTNVAAKSAVLSQRCSCRKLPDRSAAAGLAALPCSLVAESRLIAELSDCRTVDVARLHV